MRLQIVALRELLAAVTALVRPLAGVRPSVPPQVRLLRELAVADVARVRPLARVHAEVYLEDAVVGEPPLADGTAKPARLVDGLRIIGQLLVAAHVLLQVAALRERHLADRAGEGALARVSPEVGLQVVALRKPPATLWAREWTLARVCPEVALEIRRLDERLLAVRTNERFGR